MKSVMLSIRPKWCEKIASGVKTIEVRKTKPKLETPFKCYIYCTNPQTKEPRQILEKHTDGKIYRCNGKVIGEFTCNEISRIAIPYPAYQHLLDRRWIDKSCLTYMELHRYCYHNDAYFWHITGLKIYDKPRELGEFVPFCKGYEDGECTIWQKTGCEHQKKDYNPDGVLNVCECVKRMQRAPQSWCYVEEWEENECG